MPSSLLFLYPSQLVFPLYPRTAQSRYVSAYLCGGSERLRIKDPQALHGGTKTPCRARGGCAAPSESMAESRVPSKLPVLKGVWGILSPPRSLLDCREASVSLNLHSHL